MRTATLHAGALSISIVATSAARAEAPPDEHPLAAMTLSLTRERPYRFVLAYDGPTIELRGRICYGFAGYTETCLEPKLNWLTAASEIVLYAPGGVPRDLLEGYVMRVRFPALSEDTFLYRLRGGE